MKCWYQIAGLTGSGKTAVLERLDALGAQVINLEELAGHKGSVFGFNMNGKQPSQLQFEIQLNQKIEHFQKGPIFFEAKPDVLGKLAVKDDFNGFVRNARTIYIDTPLELRVQRILNTYGKKKNLMYALLKLENRLDADSFSKALYYLNIGDLVECIKELLIYYDASNGYKKIEPVYLSVSFKNEQQTAEEIYQIFV